MSPLLLRLARKTVETSEISAFEFVSADGSLLPAFGAGAHVDFTLGDNLVRSYSLCNTPLTRERYRFGVLRAAQSRGGSLAMHALCVGDVVRATMPKNSFPLADAPEHVLLAGGIGITPLLSMAIALHEQGRTFDLHYAVRSAEAAAFVGELASAPFSSRVQIHYDNGPMAQRLNLDSVLAQPSLSKHLYVCGPHGLIELVLERARNGGWADGNVHHELFGAAPIAQQSDTSFEVAIAATGERHEVPVGKTVVQVLRAAGMDLPTSCEEGICGTCLTKVVSGVPDHRDSYLTPEERASNDRFLPCCSRSMTPTLTIDLG